MKAPELESPLAKTMQVLTCTAPGCDQGQGYPYKTPNMPDADAKMMLNMHVAWHARRNPPDPELAKEKALRVNTKTATKIQILLILPAPRSV